MQHFPLSESHSSVGYGNLILDYTKKLVDYIGESKI